MDFEQLVCFKKVAELEHITKAAEELYISQSSLSISIQKIESELGVQLFERKGRNICLNEYGRVLMSHTDEILNAYSSVCSEIKALYDKQYNCLSISSCALFRFPGLIDEIYERFPDINFEYCDYPVENMQEVIESGKVDFCISPYTFSKPVKSITLSESNVVVLASKKHPIAALKKPQKNDYEKYNFILYNESYPIRAFQDQLISKMGIKPKITGISKGMKDSVQAVRTGRFLTIIPEAIFDNVNRDDVFVKFLVDDPNVKWKHVLSSCDFSGKKKLVKEVESLILNHFDI